MESGRIAASYKILLLPELKEITVIISGLISCAICSSWPDSFVRPVSSREPSGGWRKTPLRLRRSWASYFIVSCINPE